MAVDEDKKLLNISDLLFRCLNYRNIKNLGHEDTQNLLDELHEDYEKYPYFSGVLESNVNFYCLELRPFLQNLYQARFVLPCKKPLEFVSYAVSNCRDFLVRDWKFLNNEIGHRDMCHFHFNMCCAIISELLHFCLKFKCYTFLEFGARAFRVVYRRYLEPRFVLSGGWEALEGFCLRSYQDCSVKGFEVQARPGRARRRKSDIGLLGLRKSAPKVIEIRKRIEYSINFFSGTIDLTKEESLMVGGFASYKYPMLVGYESKESCKVCRFKCTGCYEIYIETYDEITP